MRVAVVGTGVSGLVSAHLLRRRHDVTLYEAEGRPGGHAHTVTAPLADGDLAVDTGFLVYNERTYPGLVRLFDELGVPTQPSDMSFSVSDQRSGLEYRGTSFSTVFAQRGNLASPAFLRMLVEIGRFNRLARTLVDQPADPEFTLGRLLARGTWSAMFLDCYLIPLAASIWSADPAAVTDMPASTVARFFERHGMLAVGDKPQWRTVTGGSATYVEAVLAPLRAEGRLHLSSPVTAVRRTPDAVELRGGSEGATGPGTWRAFDHVVMATHADQALELLVDPTPGEKEVLGAFRYQANDVVLHTDSRLMPRQRRAWASWNFHRLTDEVPAVTMTYHLNQLQSLPTSTPVLVTLNRTDSIEPGKVLQCFDYAHPVLDSAAVAAQRRQLEVSAGHRLSFCGAYWGYGFHEDGVQSAVRICEQLGVRW